MKDIIKALEKNKDRLQKIRSYMGREELLAGLMEECGEGIQAASKLRRSLDGKNPTPVLPIIADEDLQEELADIFLYAYLVGIDTDLIAENICKKVPRWYDRLGLDVEK